MLTAFNESVDVLRQLGTGVVEIELPPLALYNATAFLIARSEGFAIHEKTLRERPRDYGALARDRLTIGAYIRASDAASAADIGRDDNSGDARARRHSVADGS